jgi:hypothetical protein
MSSLQSFNGSELNCGACFLLRVAAESESWPPVQGLQDLKKSPKKSLLLGARGTNLSRNQDVLEKDLMCA